MPLPAWKDRHCRQGLILRTTAAAPGSAESNITLKERLVPLIERAKAMANLQGRPWSCPDHWPAWSEQTQGGAAVSEIVANLLENGFATALQAVPSVWP